MNKLLRRLAGDHFGSPLLLLMGAVGFTLPVLFDSARFGTPVAPWLLASLGSLVVMYLWLRLLRFVFLDRFLAGQPGPRPDVLRRVLLNLSVFLSLAMVRIFSYGPASVWLGLADSVDFKYRVWAATGLSLMVWVVSFNSTGAREEHARLTQRLTNARAELVSLRLDASKALAQEPMLLRESTLAILEPKVASIVQQIDTSAEAKSRIIASLRELVGQTLSGHIKSVTAEPETIAPKPRTQLRLRDFAIPRSFKFRPHLQPLQLALLVCIPLLAIVANGGGAPALLVFTPIVVAGFLALAIVKQLIPANFEVPTPLGVVLIALYPTLFLAPSYMALAVAFEGNRYLENLAVLHLSIMGLLALVQSSGHHFNITLGNFERELENHNSRLSRELAMLRRKRWLLRRNWQLKLHGEFQSGLTAILMRLSSPNGGGKIDLRFVRLELEAIMDRLRNADFEPKPFEQAFESVAENWRGVAEVKVDLSEQVRRNLARDQEASQSAAELLRELTSNAVRHGDATQIHFRVELDENHNLRISSRNNGAPLAQSEPGLGSELFSALCLEWSIKNSGGSKGTMFSALLPLRQFSN